MKWLFAILVALNIIVFGSMVAGKLVRLPAAAAPTASAPIPAPPPEPAVPVVSVSSTPASAAPATPPPAVKTEAQLRAEAAAKARAEAAAKARAEAAKTAAAQNPPPAAGNNTPPPGNCSATAVLPEDDYHRIKGLLSRWPHAASRFVEQSSQKPARTASRTRYMVSASGGDEVRQQLREQGFDVAVNNGQISLGVFNRRSDAEALLARAKISGVNQVQIVTLGGEADEAGGQSMSVAKMRLNFIHVDDQAARDINQVIQRYGRLQRGACKR